MIHFVGAGPGAPDLITLRGAELLQRAGMVVYAGSLVNPELLEMTPTGCEIYDSASMTLEQVLEKLAAGEKKGVTTVRLHTGDPSLYGAVREQMDGLKKLGIEFDVVPGVSSFCAAAAAARVEYTLPGVSQTVIITRMEGRTLVPEREKLSLLARHRASMALFLSSGLLKESCKALTDEDCYAPDTKAAIVYKASWPEEMVLRGTVGTIAAQAEAAGIKNTALLLVGDFLGDDYDLSKLYDASFSHAFREASK
jgi:precorrin-4/cobalt-precorrin-4 C11-methyltransferase